jgi:NADPH-dependent 2,4-dienoyl-CoA reductase/sulfur reductase-like enzyme
LQSQEEGGNDAFDTAYVAKILENAGVDYIHFSNGTLYDVGTLLPPTGKPHALNAIYTDIIKKAINIPIGVVGRIKEPWVADMLIEQERVDFVFIGRALICDPEFVNKSLHGDFDDVRPCIGCLTCLATSAQGITMQCTMNPGIANYRLKDIKTTSLKKNIVVVGAGPAGIEAATTAAKRGHKVTLIERESYLGGQFSFASFPLVKQELACGLKYLIRELKKTNVEIKTNTVVTAKMIESLQPDEIIIATGAEPAMPTWIIESNHGNIVSAWDILKGVAPAGLNVFVIGGGSVGCEVAEFMSNRHNYRALGERKITLIEMLDNIDTTDYTANRDYLMARLAQKPIDIVTGAKVSEISTNAVSYIKDGIETIIKGIDTIVIAMGSKSVNTLAEDFIELHIPTHVIGDANTVGKIVNAIASGRELALAL